MQEYLIVAVLLHPVFLGGFVAVISGVTHSEKSDPQFLDLIFIRVQALQNLAFLASRFDTHS